MFILLEKVVSFLFIFNWVFFFFYILYVTTMDWEQGDSIDSIATKVLESLKLRFPLIFCDGF